MFSVSEIEWYRNNIIVPHSVSIYFYTTAEPHYLIKITHVYGNGALIQRDPLYFWHSKLLHLLKYMLVDFSDMETI